MGGFFDDPEFEGMDPYEQLKLARELEGRYVTPEEKSEIGKKNLYALLSALPVTGNILAAYELPGSLRDTGKAAKEGRVGATAGNAALSALNIAGALSPLPWGRQAGKAAKGAKDSVNVFVPALKNDPMTHRATDMRLSGKPPEQVWKKSGRLVSPEGIIKEEIPDTGMRVRVDKAPGEYELGQIMQHPQLTDVYPSMKRMPVTLTKDVTRSGEPIARTRGGGFELTAGMADAKRQLAKLLQYDIADREGFARAVKHGNVALGDALTDADANARALLRRNISPTDEAAARAYLGDIADRRDILDLSSGGNGIPARALGKLNTGNVEAKVAQVRAGGTEDDLARFPLQRSGTYGEHKWKGPDFDSMFAVPPVEVSPNEMLEFVRNWRTMGAGRRDK